MPHFFTSSSLTSAGSHLRVDGLSFSYADRRVLTDISFVVPAGDRVGLIGENGSGKSTLLRAVAGVLEPDTGAVTINAPHDEKPTIGLLHQEPPFSATETIEQSLQTAVAKPRRAGSEVDALAVALANNPNDPAIADAYAGALEKAERLGAWEIDARISAVLTGLGLGYIDRERLTGSLSGGQRARLALAWLLLNKPDVLLLDEPTNHLDDAATSFLVSALKEWRGPLLVASHDRAFLDEAITSLLDLDPSPIPQAVVGAVNSEGGTSGIGVTRFTGRYSEYLVERAALRKGWEQQYQEEQAEIARLRREVSRQQVVGHSNWQPRSEVRMAQKFYADRNAQVVSRRVNDARTRLSELENRQVRKPPQDLKFKGVLAAGEPQIGGPVEPVLTATNAALAERLPATSLSISRGEHWLLTGPNGTGKSTLLGLLAGTLEPSSGSVTRSSVDRIGLLSQETYLADPYGRGSSRSVLETYADLVGRDRAARTPLSTFGLIAGYDYNRKVQDLSVGQQRRLALAVILADPPEILLLDEPTNHFSLSLVSSLEGALAAYPGTVVVASHDRWLRKRWAGHRLTLPGGD